MHASTPELIHDTDPGLRELLLAFLRANGHAAPLQSPLAGADPYSADVLLIDLTPTRQGTGACRVLQLRADLSGLILRAIDGEAARPLAAAGTQRRMTDSDTRALFAQVLALRRSQGMLAASNDAPAGATARFAGLKLELATRRLIDPDDVTASIPHTEFALLLAFLDHPRRVLTREQLVRQTRGTDIYTTERTLDVYVSRLRRRLRAGTAGPNIIGTRRNQGYVLEADVAFE